MAEPATAATAADSITVTPQFAQPDPATLDRTVAFETPDGTALAAGAVAAQSSPAPRKPRVRRRRPDQEGEHDQT
jgi:hypothetical protein